jgi:excisionase family DNA binding protein
MDTNRGELITVSRAARVIGCAENTVRKLSDAGKLPTERVGAMRLFRLADVEQFREQRDRAANPCT